MSKASNYSKGIQLWFLLDPIPTSLIADYLDNKKISLSIKDWITVTAQMSVQISREKCK